jgi:hypothetical protein
LKNKSNRGTTQLIAEEIIMSETPFQIEQGIPMPPHARLPKMPFKDLQPGDSFLIPDLVGDPNNEMAVRQRIFRYQQKNKPVRLSLVRDKEISGAMRLFRLRDRDE